MLFSNTSTEQFLSEHQGFSNTKYPEIQMLAKQHIRVTIARLVINKDVSYFVVRMDDDLGSNYRVVEVDVGADDTLRVYKTLAFAGNLDCALSKMHELGCIAKGMPVTIEEKKHYYCV